MATGTSTEGGGRRLPFLAKWGALLLRHDTAVPSLGFSVACVAFVFVLFYRCAAALRSCPASSTAVPYRGAVVLLPLSASAYERSAAQRYRAKTRKSATQSIDALLRVMYPASVLASSLICAVLFWPVLHCLLLLWTLAKSKARRARYLVESPSREIGCRK